MLPFFNETLPKRRSYFRPPTLLTALVLSLAAAAFASQPPWQKPAASWSADDIATLLNSSPWSLETAAVMEDPEDTAMDPRPVGPPDTGEKGTGAPKPRWDGEPGKNRIGRLATVPITVRWESALPIRQAQKDAAAPADSYVISITGLVPTNRYRAKGTTATTSSSDDSVDARNPEDLLEAFMAYSRIAVKGYPDLKPENAKLDPATGTVRIFFPRSRPIDTSEKEAVFITHFGSLNVRAKFRLAAMKYHGAIEL
jgi:hypothetical protein